VSLVVQALYAMLFWALFVVWIVVALGGALVLGLCAVGRPALRRRWVDGWTRRISRCIVGMNPGWTVRVTGVERARRSQPYVVCMNHQSYVDVLLLGYVPLRWRYVAKESLFRIPILGSLFRLAGTIPVRRHDPFSRRDALARCRDALAAGDSVGFFPEGTRSLTGELGPFRTGAFRLAVEAGRPVLPIAIVGTHAAVRPGSWLVAPRAVLEVHVCEPIEPTAAGEIEVLAQRVRERIARS
jgi:1-acyl-sn-glycerol-3-phosphate acyltransferase